MGYDEFKFANNPAAAVESHVPTGAWMVIWVVVFLFAGLGAWAYMAEVEQTARGAGKVIPSSQTQLVENLEQGVISQILVAAGDKVEKGQVLVRTDDALAKAKLDELHQRKAALSAEFARLRAQARGDSEFQMPSDATALDEPFYRDQIAVFNSDLQNGKKQNFVREQQLAQRRQALQEAEATQEKNNALLALRERELELSRKLNKSGALPELGLLSVERSVSELRSDVNILASAQKRLAAEVNEAGGLIEADEASDIAKIVERISQVNAELSVVNNALKEAEYRVGQTALRSPVNGVINRLNVSSLGEVVQAGTTIAEIIPTDDTLLIEARIRPQDIAFVRPGLKAVIRLTAYDYTKYGSLTGKVVRIGADTIQDENRETFYQIIISTSVEENPRLASDIQIIPGMVASVEILIGNRTVLEYLLKPVLKIRDSAFRDPR